MARVQKVEHCRSSVLWGDVIDESCVQLCLSARVVCLLVLVTLGSLLLSRGLFLCGLAAMPSEMLLGTALCGEMSENGRGEQSWEGCSCGTAQ